MRFCLPRAGCPVLTVVALVASAVLSAQEPSAPQTAPPPDASLGGEVTILARGREMAKERLVAWGDVEVRYRGLRLFADRIEYDIGTKDVLAEGDVVVQSEGEVLRAERIVFNLETGQGRVEKASGLVPPSLFFEAESLERRRSDVYGLTRARVTACAQPVPRWSFDLSRAELRKDDRVEMWGAVVRVKNVPVLYLPYLRYPLRERATGFLMPRIGFSGPKGLLFAQSFYWAIAPNIDATIGAELYPSRGLGLGLEARYLLGPRTRGELNLYHFLPRKEETGLRPGASSIVRLSHAQALPGGFSLVANVDYQSSFSFLREYDNDVQRALVFNRTSQVYLSRSWKKINVSARASRFETYFAELDDSNVTTSLPQIELNVLKTRLVRPLYFSLAASYSRWQYGWKSQYEAGTERRSSRLAVNPTLSVPFTSVPWLTAAASVTGHLVYHGQSLDPSTGGIVDEPLFAPNFAVGLEVTGPVLYRLFYGRDGQPRLKNIIEPYASYAYESPVSRADRVVTPFGFFRTHQLSYGLTTRFLYKQGDRTEEVLSLNVGQTFYLSPEDGPLSPFPVDGKPPRFSEISSTLRFYPRARFSLDASVAYNPYYKNLSGLRLGATAGDKGGGDFVSLSWLRSRNSWVTGVDPALIALYNRDQIGVFAGTRLRRLGLDLQVAADYNLGEGRLLHTGVQAVYHWQCLDIRVDVRVFNFRDRPDAQVRVSLGLGAIGQTLDLLGGFGF